MAALGLILFLINEEWGLPYFFLFLLKKSPEIDGGIEFVKVESSSNILDVDFVYVNIFNQIKSVFFFGNILIDNGVNTLSRSNLKNKVDRKIVTSIYFE